MKKYSLIILTFIVVLAGSFSLAPDRDFSYSKNDESAIAATPMIDLGPLQLNLGKISYDFLFVLAEKLQAFYQDSLIYLFSPLEYYLDIYTLTTIRQYHLLI